jgi:mRNA interferase RelE/StbE
LAERDFKSFSKGKKEQVLLLILKQAQKGADFKPKVNDNQLNPSLHQFAKIKSKAISLRVVYRPDQMRI